MTCEDDPCPELNCAADELEGRNDDECCNKCIGNWVVVSLFFLFSINICLSPLIIQPRAHGVSSLFYKCRNIQKFFTTVAIQTLCFRQ